MDHVFRGFLTVNATCLLVVVYLVKEGICLSFLGGYMSLERVKIASYVFYMVVPVLLTKLALIFAKGLGSDNIVKGSVSSVEYASNSFLPSYLGYFFVSLSIPNFDTLIFVYIVLFMFTYMSQALYFNPMFLLFGYSFYNIKKSDGLNIFIISKQKFRATDSIEVSGMKRINNYTFLEL